jgi:hypothetical protein
MSNGATSRPPTNCARISDGAEWMAIVICLNQSPGSSPKLTRTGKTPGPSGVGVVESGMGTLLHSGAMGLGEPDDFSDAPCRSALQCGDKARPGNSAGFAGAARRDVRQPPGIGKGGCE